MFGEVERVRWACSCSWVDGGKAKEVTLLKRMDLYCYKFCTVTHLRGRGRRNGRFWAHALVVWARAGVAANSQLADVIFVVGGDS